MSSDKNAAIRTVNEKMILELTKGKFKPFVDFVKEKQGISIEDNLALCFRGSGGKDVVSIYKYNTKVWDLSFSNSIDSLGNKIYVPKVTIELNYARFYREWLKEVKELYELGFRLESTDSKKESFSYAEKNLIKPDGKIKKLVYYVDEDSFANLGNVIKESYNIISEMLEDYYLHDKKSELTERRNYFKEHYNKVNNCENTESVLGRKQIRLEKHTQQEIFMCNHSFADGLFIYDLEFHQPQKDLEGIDINDFKKNEPDMFGIYFDENGCPKSICMIEVKSTKSALGQKSGLVTHKKGMEKYLECTELMQDRVDEAVGLLSHYAKLELYGVTEEIVKKLEDNKTNLEKKIIFVFTNELKPCTEFRDGEKDTLCTIQEAMDGCVDYTKKVIYGKWCRKNSAEPFAYIK